MNKGYKIKQIAELFSLHPDTLRYYEEQGLVSPARGQNGYRCYSVQDICALGIIRMWRQLDMPISQISQYMQQRSVSQTLELLGQEQQLIAQKIEELSLLQREVKKRAADLKVSGQMVTDSPALVELPPRKCYRLESPLLQEPEVDVELKRLERDSPELSRLVGARRMGAVVDMSAVQRGCYDRFSAVLFLGEQFTDSDSHLEGGLYGSICYRGEYSGLGVALPRLLRFVAQQGCTPCGDALELYHVDVHDTLYPTEYLTEVQLPVCR